MDIRRRIVNGVDVLKELSRRGHMKPLDPARPESYLQANGWRLDPRDPIPPGSYWIDPIDGRSQHETDATSMQVCDDVMDYLEPRGWEFSGGYCSTLNGHPVRRFIFVVHNAEHRRRDLRWWSALWLQFAKDDTGSMPGWIRRARGARR